MALTSETPSAPFHLEALRQRRCSARRPLNASVEMLEPDSGEGVTINVSDGGLRIAVDVMLKVGDVVLFYVREHDKPERLERAKVAWSREQPDGCICGLQLIGLH